MLRNADPSDLRFIQSILNAPENLDKLEGYDDDVVAHAIANPDAPIFIWQGRQNPDGFCWLSLAEDSIKIEEFGVATPGGGIGSAFFTAILDHYAQDPRPLWLAVAADNTAAIRFYQRFNFTPTETRPAAWHRRKGPVADAVIMNHISALA